MPHSPSRCPSRNATGSRHRQAGTLRHGIVRGQGIYLPAKRHGTTPPHLHSRITIVTYKKKPPLPYRNRPTLPLRVLRHYPCLAMFPFCPVSVPLVCSCYPTLCSPTVRVLLPCPRFGWMRVCMIVCSRSICSRGLYFPFASFSLFLWCRILCGRRGSIVFGFVEFCCHFP